MYYDTAQHIVEIKYVWVSLLAMIAWIVVKCKFFLKIKKNFSFFDEFLFM